MTGFNVNQTTINSERLFLPRMRLKGIGTRVFTGIDN